MNIKIADQAREIPEGVSVEELLKLEQVDMPEYVTVQVNEGFVRREDFATTTLQEGDQVEFMYYMGGGGTSGLEQ